MFFTLERPDKQLPELYSSKNLLTLIGFFNSLPKDKYLYWDKIKYIEPFPKEIPKEYLWSVIKLQRQSQQIKTVIKDKDGNSFHWLKLGYFEELFHRLDMNTGGELFIKKTEMNKTTKQKLIIHGIMEEAIASSQLEGAATSRQAAKKMLREGRKPINKSEQMILNNYISMKAIEEKFKEKVMSIDLILELHSMITKDTLDSGNAPPKIRAGNESVYVIDNTSNTIYHEAPDSHFVKKELNVLVKFANDEIGEDVFIHPIVKAIMLHFWMGYLHPFTDGNGRLARLIFYWYLIKKGYWAFVYLPISKVIKQSPKQYTMAYVYSEQDDNDLTYFIDYNLRKIKSSVEDFEKYLRNQSNDNAQMKKKCDVELGLNIRQVQLLQYFYGDSDAQTTLKTHMNINQISKMTAITDLKKLVEKEFLIVRKQGRNVYYFGTDKIKELF